MLKHCRTVTPITTRDTPSSHGVSGGEAVSNTRRSSSVPPKLDRNMVQENAPRSEQSLVEVRASVVRYDEAYKKWIPSGDSPSGVSKVQIFHEPVNKTYRVVGRKLQDKEVTLNTMLSHSLRYSEATATFHQWRDSLKIIHGLHFSTKDYAVSFSKAINAVLRILQLQTLPDQPLSQGGVNEQLHIEVPQAAGSISSSQTEIPSNLTGDNLLLKNGTVKHNNFTTSPYLQSPQQQQQQINPTWQVPSPSSQQSQWMPISASEHVRENGLYQYPAKSQSFTNVGGSYSTNTTVPQPLYSEPTIKQNGLSPEKYNGYYSSPPTNYSHQPTNTNAINNNSSRYVNNYGKPQEWQQQSSFGQAPPSGDTHTSASLFAVPSTYTQPGPNLHQRDRSASSDSLLSEKEIAHQTRTGSVLLDRKLNTAADTTPSLAPLLPGPPPPPPIPVGGIPPPPRSTVSSAGQLSGLAAALQSTVLKKTTPKVETNGIPAPLVGTKAVLMEEMQRKLARRRAKADGEDVPSNCSSIRSSPFHAISRSNTTSPKPFVQRPALQYQDTMFDHTKIASQSTDVTQQNDESTAGTQIIDQPSELTISPQLQQLKQELLVELRNDLSQLRRELLAAIRNDPAESINP